MLRGNLSTFKASRRGADGADFLGYFPFLASFKVFGRWKVADVRTFFPYLPRLPLRAAFFDPRAFLAGSTISFTVLVFWNGLTDYLS